MWQFGLHVACFRLADISTIQMDTEDFRIGFHLLWRFAFVDIAEK